MTRKPVPPAPALGILETILKRLDDIDARLDILMAEPKSEPEPEPTTPSEQDQRLDKYMTRKDVLRRFHISSSGLHLFRTHADPDRRFPPPTLIMGQTPLWAIDVVEAFDNRQRELSKERRVRQPVIPDSTDSQLTISNRSRGAQQRRTKRKARTT